MKKVILNTIAAVLTMVGLAGLTSLAPNAYADVLCPNGKTAPSLETCEGYTGKEGVFESRDLMDVLTIIINVIVGIVGFVAVAMIVMGGISFATSQGDTAKVAKARNTILYGVVGLVVALLAFAIVNFVLKSVFSN